MRVNMLCGSRSEIALKQFLSGIAPLLLERGGEGESREGGRGKERYGVCVCVRERGVGRGRGGGGREG